MLKAAPALVEQIKWNAPSLAIEGDDRLTMHLPPRGGLQLIFHRGARSKAAADFRFDDPAGLLTWPAADRGVLDLGDIGRLEDRAHDIADLARRWVKATR